MPYRPPFMYPPPFPFLPRSEISEPSPLPPHSLPEHNLAVPLNRGRGIYFRGRAMPIRGGLAPDRS